MATEKTNESVPVEHVSDAEDINITSSPGKQGTADGELAENEQDIPLAEDTAPEVAAGEPVQVAKATGSEILCEADTVPSVAPVDHVQTATENSQEQEPKAAPNSPEPADLNEPPAQAEIKTGLQEAAITDTGSQTEQPQQEEAGTLDFSDEEAHIAANAPEFDLGDTSDEETESSDTSGFELTGKSKEEILDIFASLLADKPVQTLRRNVESIKVAFYKIHRAEEEQLRKTFIEEGGIAEDFVAPADPMEQRLKDLFGEYRRKRDDFIANLEKNKEDNLQVKLAIIDELKELINKGETLNNTFNTFRDLQQRWKEAGPVPQGRVKDLWETYNHHVENFYSFIKINKELRDLDLRKNYEAKVALCEEAEALILEPSIVNAFHKLQKLHEQWRETGPVANEYKETLWDRFREASSRINKQHQEYFERLKDEQKANLDLKTELCVKTEELVNGVYTSRKDWNRASDKLLEIQKVWKTIGFAPKKDNARIYERFRTACDGFFEQKRNYYTQLKTEMDLNLQLKTEICEAAEAVQNSEEWKKTTDELIALQKKWKEIGPVARRHSDSVWKRFRTACDSFFERKSQHFSSMDSEQEENLRRKRELLAEIEQCDITEGGFDMIKDFQRRWSEIGFVPIKQKDAVQKEYKAVMDRLFSTLRGTEQSRHFDRFRGKVQNMKGSGDRRLRNERDKLYNRVKQLESDIALLENNIGFFSKSKNAESMIQDVRDKIEKAKEEMALTIEKINLIDNEQE